MNGSRTGGTTSGLRLLVVAPASRRRAVQDRTCPADQETLRTLAGNGSLTSSAHLNLSMTMA